MPAERRMYRAYLLRLWPAGADPDGSTVWCASLEDPHTGERLGFATLEQLFVYLMAQTEGRGAPVPQTAAQDEPPG